MTSDRDKILDIHVGSQPNDTSCGATCLEAVYRYYGYPVTLDQVLAEVTHLDAGGTLAVYLALHALRQGFQATIYTYNLQVFDPTWFRDPNTDIRSKLKRQIAYKKKRKLHDTCRAYLEFLEKGGILRYKSPTGHLLRGYLNRQVPILTGLCATYLYHAARELSVDGRQLSDDVQGEPTGHFVVLAGYRKQDRAVWVADPLQPNPLSKSGRYHVDVHRLVCAIMLGIVTYDANLLVIEPKGKQHPWRI